MQGTCKFCDANRHYGFVMNEGGEWFFHGANVNGQLPRKGDAVTFWLDYSERRGNVVAVEVQRLGYTEKLGDS